VTAVLFDNPDSVRVRRSAKWSGSGTWCRVATRSVGVAVKGGIESRLDRRANGGGKWQVAMLFLAAYAYKKSQQ